MSYRKNPTDKQQSELEQAANDGGITVEVAGKQRVITKVVATAPYRTAHGATQRANAGVVVPHDDVPGRFVETTQGKA